jgi:hypothetical protein
MRVKLSGMNQSSAVTRTAAVEAITASSRHCLQAKADQARCARSRALIPGRSLHELACTTLLRQPGAKHGRIAGDGG